MTRLPSFDDFLDSTPFNSFLADSQTARHIYENIICTEEMQRKLAEMSDKGKPAILASGPAVEEYFRMHKDECDLRLKDDQVRQAIGRMNKEVLEALGYTKVGDHVDLEKGICEHFKSGTVFAKKA